MAATGIDTSKLNAVAKSLQEVSGNFRTATKKLYETGQQIDKMWTGDASKSFMNTFHNDQQNFEALAKLLDTYSEMLKQSAAIYSKAENDAKDIVSKGMARG